MKFFLIGLGGAVGTWARYLIAETFPNGTLIVNLLGSFLICFIMQFALSSELVSPQLRVILVAGVLGGFTTYSSFNYETMVLLQGGQPLKALASVMMMLCGCLIAGWVGQQAALGVRALTSF